MRKIIGNIKSTFNIDYVNKPIIFTLCNKYNQQIKQLNNTLVPVYVKVITNDNSEFEIELFETSDSKIQIHYLMSFENNIIDPIKLYISSGNKTIDFLDLILKPVDLKTFYYLDENGKYTFDVEIIFLIDRFLMYKNNFATSLEKKLFIEYVKYANGIINSQSMKALDEQIATYIHKQSREYITINNIVNDTNISKEKEILITLDNLKSLEINTQNIINNGVEQAMKKAFKQTLLFA